MKRNTGWRACMLSGLLLACCEATALSQGVLLAPGREFNEFEEQADDDEPALLAYRRVVRSTFAAARNGANFETWLLDGLPRAAEQKRLEAIVGLRVAAIDEACRLSEAQKQKLQLAGAADVRAYLQAVDAAAGKIQRELLFQQGKIDDLIDDLQDLKLRRDYDLAGGSSFFAKALRTALTEDQTAQTTISERDSRASGYMRLVASTISRLKEPAELSDEQCRRIALLLLERSPPPAFSGPCDRDVVLLQLAELPAAAFLPIFDAVQWQSFDRYLARYRASGPQLRRLGLIAEPLEQPPARPETPVGAAANDAAAKLQASLMELLKVDETPKPQMPKRSWGPEQAAGPPDTFRGGDFQTAWASKTPDENPEWLVCRFAQSVAATAVVIHETCCPGAVNKVSLFDGDDKEIVVWEGLDPTPRGQLMGTSVIPVKVNFRTKKVKIYIDSPAVFGFNEIDAVALQDQREELYWAQKVTASSTFAALFGNQGMGMQPSKRGWAPEQAEGPPDTRRAGDSSTAWASQSTDGQEEWLLCHYADAVHARALFIYETLGPGAVNKVTAFDERGQEVTVWEGIDPTPRDQRIGVSVIPIRPGFKASKFRIHIDSPAVAGYNEIDAVGLRDAAGSLQWAKKVEASSIFGAAQPQPAISTAELQRLRRLDTEVAELRKELARVKQDLEGSLDEIKRLLKERPGK